MKIQTFHLDQTVTDGQFAALIGIDDTTVNEWRRKGRLPTPLVVGPALYAYCHRLREQAALRLGSGDSKLDLMHERAALAKAQREGVVLKNQVLRGQHAEIALLERVLAASAGAVVERFEHLPARIRTACPDLPPAAIDEVMKTIAEARNEWAAGMASLVLDQTAPDEDEEPELPLEEGEAGARA
jgi:phage terminase Nu1 subunit (DNA packaging protein)